MKSFLLSIHLTFVGIWLGCVLTEALFERALLGKGSEQELILAALHKRVDIFVEIPAILMVFLTGCLMYTTASQSPSLGAKIGFGLFAMIANLYCAWLVFRRSSHAASDDWVAFRRVDYLQHKIGAIVLLGILLALGIGFFRLIR